MNLRIAAIRSGSEPIRKLATGSFQRWLETPLACPKCDTTYNLAVDWDQSTDRWFPETSRPLITLLKKAIMMGHSTNHRVTHFETEGVVVESITSSHHETQCPRSRRNKDGRDGDSCSIVLASCTDEGPSRTEQGTAPPDRD
jgi:hypothetical protein